MKLRIGQGFDLHRLTTGRKLILGGVHIPYEFGLAGHSDADVLIHAIIDSLLGALCLGDIGALFPDNDPKFKDIDSIILLKHVTELVGKHNYVINNLDTTLIIEQPKLRPYIDIIRESLANAMGIDLDQVSVKAKTSEKVGIVGRQEAIVAESIVLLVQKI